MLGPGSDNTVKNNWYSKKGRPSKRRREAEEATLVVPRAAALAIPGAAAPTAATNVATDASAAAATVVAIAVNEIVKLIRAKPKRHCA